MNLVITTPDELSRIVQSAIRTALAEQSTITNTNSTFRKLYDMDEAAAYTKQPKSSLYKATSKRQISFIKRGRPIFFTKESLDKWLEEGRKKTRAELEQEAMQEISKGGRQR